MQILQTFAGLFSNFGNLTWQMVVMWVIGGLLIYLAIVKKMEPSLLLPMGFGAILVNLPLSGAITQGDTVGPISALFEAGMSNELFPLLLFIGIGAMIDFGPLLEKPWLMLFGAAAQFGIFITLVPRPSQSSVRPTARRPSLWRTAWAASIWGPSWWQPTAIWRWCPLYSRRSLNCVLPEKSGSSACLIKKEA